MAASVLNSTQAIEMSIYLVRTFVAMREAIATTHELAKRLDELERSLEARFARHDEAIAEILAALRALMTPPAAKRRPIGFIGPAESG